MTLAEQRPAAPPIARLITVETVYVGEAHPDEAFEVSGGELFNFSGLPVLLITQQ